MRKFAVIPLLFIIFACASFEPEIVNQGAVYEMRGFELSLEDNVLTVKNTYSEKVSRLQVDAEYIKDDAVIGTFVSVGIALEPGGERLYTLVIPQGTDKVKVSYREYPYGEEGGSLFIPNTGRVGKTGAVYFILKN